MSLMLLILKGNSFDMVYYGHFLERSCHYTSIMRPFSTFIWQWLRIQVEWNKFPLKMLKTMLEDDLYPRPVVSVTCRSQGGRTIARYAIAAS